MLILVPAGGNTPRGSEIGAWPQVGTKQRQMSLFFPFAQPEGDEGATATLKGEVKTRQGAEVREGD